MYRHMRRTPRLVGTLALLVLALVVCAALTYQAWDAARSQRAMAERTLQDYAKIADWQLTQQAKNLLLGQIVTSLIQPASRLQPDSLQRTRYSPAEVGEIARDMMMWCKCLDGVQYFFRYDWQDSTFRTTDTDVPDADLARVRDTMVAYVNDMASPPADRGVVHFVTPDGRSMRQSAVILTNDSYVMLFDEHDKKLQLVVFVVARDIRRRMPVELYGYVTEPKPVLPPVFAQIRGTHESASSLLPEALIHRPPIDSILSISVTTANGREVYRAGWAAPTFSAAATVEPNFGRLKMKVSLNKDFAPMLVVGGLPESRVPILGALFVLAAGLLTVAVIQLRRQQQLARLRTEFVSGVSHELRTPLAQIRWFAELLHLGKLRSDDERERSAGIIDQEARRL